MPTKKTSHHGTSKEVFLHLLVMIVLYAAAISVLTVLFQIINLQIPDPLTSTAYSYSRTQYYGPMRFAIATLIVTFPAFMILSWYLQNQYRREPARRQTRLRKWLLHSTLFLASLIMGGDLISIIYNYLNGELTSRFMLKALSVLIVAGVIFGYYLWDLKQEKVNENARWFAIPVIIAVGALIVAGFFVIGSPQQQRAYRFDDERVSDLQQISWAVNSYYSTHSSLPTQLSALDSEYVSSSTLEDPETKALYEYRTVEGSTYEICATFAYASLNQGESDAPSPLIRVKPGYNPWQHGAGRTCFQETAQK